MEEEMLHLSQIEDCVRHTECGRAITNDFAFCERHASMKRKGFIDDKRHIEYQQTLQANSIHDCLKYSTLPPQI
ncbi:hypothetical protein EYF80_000545 [Liparis tanakae]|uniref:Uncharacterized protein n=1 Tax=Liparis tanakae TaxID=230148 RepID=A0A4Z2JH31_9TELE|nr:hypothetical protein EYF80_000545 [Liparis tanakae]